jgi:dsDNA-specific endonuclease/ATPase MutS2
MLAHTLKKLNAYKVVYHFDRLKAARNALPESDNRLNYYSQIGKYNAGNIDELRQSLTRKAKLQTVDGQQQFVVNDEVQNLDVSEIGNVVSGGRFLGFN